MHHYRFYNLGRDNRIVSAQDVDCRDDLDALDAGEKASGAGPVEIWQGKRLVARVKEGNAPLNVFDRTSL